MSTMRAIPVASPDSNPPAGNHPRIPAKVINRSIPSQPSGIEYRTSDPYRVEVSNRLPRSQPPLIPIRIPSTLAKSVPSPTSSSVGPSREPMMSQTGRAVRSDTPRFPLTVWRTYVTYWRGSGWSSPSVARCSAMSASVSRWLRASSPIGSPGSTRNRKKLKVSTNSSVASACSSLLSRYRRAPTRGVPRPLFAQASSRSRRRPRRTNQIEIAAIPPITTSHSHPGTPDEVDAVPDEDATGWTAISES